MAKTIFVKTWGCQMNVYDSQKMLDVLSPLGYTATDTPDDADIVILNTCHIREKATDKVFSDLGRFKKHKDHNATLGKKQLLAVAGCVAQAEGEFIAERAPYVDMIIGPQTYHKLPEMVADAFDLYGQKRVINTDFAAHDKFDLLPQQQDNIGPSAFLSIQEGCDKFCAFCVVPYTRGAEYSRPVAQVLSEAEQLLSGGAKELTVLGQNVNAYHGAAPNGGTWNMGQLLYALAALKGLERIRYMTSHPRDMHEELYTAHRDLPQVMPWLHLPVQSGSDKILNTMNRKHTRDDYLKMIDRLLQCRPDMVFSTDIIIGFPGETDADFNDTCDLVRQVNFVQSYSFKYSARPGTPATALSNLVPDKIKDERLQILQALLVQQTKAFNERFVGKTIPVLFDKIGDRANQLHGRSVYGQPVYAEGNPRLVGQTMDIAIETATLSALTGKILLAST